MKTEYSFKNVPPQLMGKLHLLLLQCNFLFKVVHNIHLSYGDANSYSIFKISILKGALFVVATLDGPRTTESSDKDQQAPRSILCKQHSDSQRKNVKFQGEQMLIFRIR